MFFGRDELLAFGREEAVTITIYASSETDLYAYLHAHSMGCWRRWKFEEIETGVWQGDWVTSIIPGIRGIAFDVVTKASIDYVGFSCAANIWLFPYRVE